MIKGDNLPQIRLEVNEYTLRVLDVMKGKHGLKNRSQALDKFAEVYGEDLVEPEFDEEYLKELDAIYKEYKKNPQKRAMTSEDLDDFFNNL